MAADEDGGDADGGSYDTGVTRVTLTRRFSLQFFSQAPPTHTHTFQPSPEDVFEKHILMRRIYHRKVLGSDQGPGN